HVTPIGASDSHDVLRHFVGQARTYIRCEDSNPGDIDVAGAINNLLSGHVRVCYGLIVELSVHGRTSGEVVRLDKDADARGSVEVDLRMLAPHWITADRLVLFVNGEPVREIEIPTQLEDPAPVGVKWTGRVTIDRPA